MILRLEKKLIQIGQDTELPDWSFNHYYNLLSSKEAEVYYLVPKTKDDAEKCHFCKSQKEMP